MRALGITSDRTRLGLCRGGTLIAGVDPEPLVDHDFVWTRYRMFIGQRQAIKTRQLDIHLRQLRIATDKLFDGCPCLRAIEAGLEDFRRGRSICAGARRRADAGSEQTGEKGRDRFHGGFTQIIT